MEQVARLSESRLVGIAVRRWAVYGAIVGAVLVAKFVFGVDLADAGKSPH